MVSNHIRLDIDLHSPMRIATGRAARGLDAVLDPDWIPASSIKGVMRNAAVEILDLPTEAIERIFGAAGRPAGWWWSDVDLREVSSKRIRARVRVPINRQGVAAKGGMLNAEELWLADTVTCVIEPSTDTGAVRHDGDELLLAASALAVKGIGASRRRGLGWVTMRPFVKNSEVSAESAAQAVMEASG